MGFAACLGLWLGSLVGQMKVGVNDEWGYDSDSLPGC